MFEIVEFSIFFLCFYDADETIVAEQKRLTILHGVRY